MTVAVPSQHREIALSDRPAVVRFVKRDTARLDAERIDTPLGPALVTTPEQTVLDLAHRPVHLPGIRPKIEELLINRLRYQRMRSSLIVKNAQIARLQRSCTIQRRGRLLRVSGRQFHHPDPRQHFRIVRIFCFELFDKLIGLIILAALNIEIDFIQRQS